MDNVRLAKIGIYSAIAGFMITIGLFVTESPRPRMLRYAYLSTLACFAAYGLVAAISLTTSEEEDF